MRSFGNKDLTTFVVAARLMISADHRDAGELALGTGHGGKRNALHARHVLEGILQVEEGGQQALRDGGRR